MNLAQLRALIERAEGAPDDTKVFVENATMTLDGDLTPPTLIIADWASERIEVEGAGGPWA